MDAKKITARRNPVNNSRIESVCAECGKLRSKRFAHVTTVKGKTVFVCASCCADLYASGFGYDRSDLEFFLTEFGPRGGNAA